MSTTDATRAGLPGPPPLRILTRCADVAEFIAYFCHRVDERRMQLRLDRPRPAGTRLRFTVHLADGKVVFQGSGRVLASDAGTSTIEIVSLSDESRTMHRCLRIARGTEPPPLPPPPDLPPRPRPLPETEMEVPVNPLSAVQTQALEAFVETAIGPPPPAAPAAPEVVEALLPLPPPMVALPARRNLRPWLLVLAALVVVVLIFAR